MIEEKQPDKKQSAEKHAFRVKVTHSMRIAEEEESSFIMSHKDWARYKARLEKRPRPTEWMSNAGWLLLGLAVQTVLSILLWLVTGDTTKYGWVTPVLLFVTVGWFGMGAALLRVNKDLKRGEEYSIKMFCEDMDAIADHYAKPEP